MVNLFGFNMAVFLWRFRLRVAPLSLCQSLRDALENNTDLNLSMFSTLFIIMFKVLVSVTIRGYELLTPKNHLSSAFAMQMDIT